MDGKGPSGRGKLTERFEVEFGPFPPCCIALSRMLFAYIHRSITHRVHFLDKELPVTLQGPTTINAICSALRISQSDRLAEDIQTIFRRRRLDVVVADECDSNHEQH
jgi:hypothetical protein